MATVATKLAMVLPTITDLAPYYRRALEVEKRELAKLPENLPVELERILIASICEAATRLAQEIANQRPGVISEWAIYRQALKRVEP